MPTYTFRCSCGATEDAFLPISSDPQEVRDCDGAGGCGKKASRVREIGSGIVNFAAMQRDNKYPVASRQLPMRMRGCRTDHLGHTIIENRQHEREICAGAHGEEYVRDGVH